jgi:hypothetical protein
MKHIAWLNGEPNGERADLRNADLSDADLRGAKLHNADLRNADLSDADLRGAYLCDADLRGANLCGADLCGANLCGANLRGADLRGLQWNIASAFYQLQCPESGAYTAYKKAGGCIVELLIPADAKRSSATSRKCRASKATVISITTIDGEHLEGSVSSDYDHGFIYSVGETVEVADFDEDRWNECAPGIHHFITRMEAVKY